LKDQSQGGYKVKYLSFATVGDTRVAYALV